MTLQLQTNVWGPNRPSILPWSSFNYEQDAKDLHEAILGLESCDNKIVNILAKRTVSQRKEIAASYQTQFEKTLEEDLAQSLPDSLQNVALSSLKSVPELKAYALHKAMKGIGTIEQVLIQILAVASNNEIQQIKEAYTRVFNRDLEADVSIKTNLEFQRLMLFLLKAGRNEDLIVDGARVVNDAFMINKFGRRIYGNAERIVGNILTTRSFGHIKILAYYYKKTYGKMINKYIIDELSGNYCRTLLSTVMYAEHPTELYASWIYDAIKARGPNNDDLIRLILSRAEIDLQNIKEAYERMSEKTLIEDIEEATSGEYKNMLVALIKGNFEELQDRKN
nr:annexin [Hymenolepis microstoma]